jgi:DNA-binding CsgD family transcriptional regulator
LAGARDNPVFRQLFAAPRGDLNVRNLLPLVRVPTLVLHARHDEIVPFEAGKRLAAEIPNAEFVSLDSRNHILLADEPAWAIFKDAVLEFTGRPRAFGAHDPLLTRLSMRERQILAAVVSRQSNSEIGAALFVSEKTVRNSLTRIFEKLGVRTRTQAAVLTRDRRFSGP